MSVRISRALLDELLARAVASPELEICGLLLGNSAQISGIVPARNVSARPDRSFEIDPQALFDQARSERVGEPIMVGWYHSHPNGRAEPSQTDIDAAAGMPGKLWLILANGDATLWRSVANAGLERVDLVA